MYITVLASTLVCHVLVAVVFMLMLSSGSFFLKLPCVHI